MASFVVRRELFQRQASDMIERMPTAYCSLMRWRFRHSSWKNRVASGDTDLVIEGFQRCANSFAVQAFRSVNETQRKLKIATHMHSPANVKYATSRGIPTMVLIRNPDDCIMSWLALAVQLGKIPKDSLGREDQMRRMLYWTQRYSMFYQRLMYARSSFVIADFKQVVSDFGVCIDRLNAKFGTEFQRFQHTEATEAEIFQKSKVNLSPSVDREGIKEEVRDLYDSKQNAANRQHAVSTYEMFLS